MSRFHVSAVDPATASPRRAPDAHGAQAPQRSPQPSQPGTFEDATGWAPPPADPAGWTWQADGQG